MSKNLSKLLGRKGVADSLFDKFGKLNAENNSLAQDQLDHLANEFLIGSANTYGSVTFYDFLKEDNKNKKVYVCNGTACECSGSQEKVNSQLLKHFSAEQIGHMCCLGRCHENGAFHFNGNNFLAMICLRIRILKRKDLLLRLSRRFIIICRIMIRRLIMR